jgi:hypothetical protein
MNCSCRNQREEASKIHKQLGHLPMMRIYIQRWIAITRDGANGQMKAIENSRQPVRGGQSEYHPGNFFNY